MKGKIKTFNWQLAIYGTYILKFVQFTLSNDIRHAGTMTCQHYDIRYDDMWLTWCEQVCHYFFCWSRSCNKMWPLEDLKLTTPCHQVKIIIFILSIINIIILIHGFLLTWNLSLGHFSAAITISLLIVALSSSSSISVWPMPSWQIIITSTTT